MVYSQFCYVEGDNELYLNKLIYCLQLSFENVQMRFLWFHIVRLNTVGLNAAVQYRL
jgi:hypothetical protein